MSPYVPSQDEVLEYFDRFSNWGRWGSDDEQGTLNLITPSKRLLALETVQDGIVINCAWPIIRETPVPDIMHPPMHFMLNSGESPDATDVVDFIGMVVHGHTITHIDALSHQFWNGKFYNNRPQNLVTTREGSTQCSVDVMKDKIITRGVLLDIAELRQMPSLGPGEAIYPEDLDAAERHFNVKVTEGDALLIRTGWLERRAACGPYPHPPDRPGLHAATLPWLFERGVSVIAADAAHDVVPSGYEDISQPVHKVGMVSMGLCLIDGCQLQELREACNHRKRWEFLFIVAPLRLAAATGSPVTPLAVF
jgi:kynurenine formamidase